MLQHLILMIALYKGLSLGCFWNYESRFSLMPSAADPGQPEELSHPYLSLRFFSPGSKEIVCLIAGREMVVIPMAASIS